MPNGGEDCCGTCWFNTTNEGQPGYRKGPPAGEVRCSIRGLAIENPFWTYCSNHPHHNPERIEVPIGPVYVTDGYPYSRRVLVRCSDTEEIRSGLLVLLKRIKEAPRVEYPTPTKRDEEVIKQLLEFGEPRAAPALRKIARFNPLATPPGDNPFGRNRVGTVALAVEALATIEGDGALNELETALQRGLSKRTAAPAATSGLFSRIRKLRRPKQEQQSDDVPDPMAVIRYHAVLGLKHCKSERAKVLLQTAAHDPHPEVAALARDTLSSREADA